MTNEGHRAVARALQALEIAVASEDGVTLSELAKRVGAAKSSLHPLLKALEFRGYLTYEGHRYRAGASVNTLAAPDSVQIVPIAAPFMDDLLQRFGETVMLGSMVGETLIYLHTAESSHVVRYSPPKVRPPTSHPSSIGKLYLAQLADDELEKYVAAHVVGEKRAGLLEEVREARSSGVAINSGDTFPDLSAVAAPIVTRKGLLACMAVGGPSRRIDDRVTELADALRLATAEIGRLLDGAGSTARK